MQIELRQCDIERIQEICCDVAANSAKESVDDAVVKAVKRAIDDRVKSLTDDALRPIVDDLVTNGWPSTNSYGERNGTITMRKRVSDALFPNSSYDAPAQRILREVLERELKGELGELLKQAKLKLAEMLEGEILDKLRGYLRDGMALKK